MMIILFFCIWNESKCHKICFDKKAIENVVHMKIIHLLIQKIIRSLRWLVFGAKYPTKNLKIGFAIKLYTRWRNYWTAKETLNTLLIKEKKTHHLETLDKQKDDLSPLQTAYLNSGISNNHNNSCKFLYIKAVWPHTSYRSSPKIQNYFLYVV